MKHVLVVFYCVSILGVLTHHLPDSEKLKLKEIHEACQANPKTNVDENLLKKLSENIDNKKVGDHMLCMVVKEGLMTQDGELIKDLIKSKIAIDRQDKSEAEMLLKKCSVKYETPQKTAVLLTLCFVHNDIHYYHEV